jgi:feruloyl esterase
MKKLTSKHRSACLVAASMILPLFVASPAQPARAAEPLRSCEDMAKFSLPNAKITMAVSVAAGAFKAPGSDNKGPSMFTPFNLSGRVDEGTNPQFCRITATLTPTPDSEIKAEFWLPEKNWNGKFLSVGSFGWGGMILYPGLMSGLQEGYAVANNDAGHEGGNGEFTIGHPEKLVDYAYRANHEMTVDAKQVVKQFYGKDASYAFWIGCSLGGLQGLIEAKRYPADFDGIVAGAPPNPLVHFNALQVWPSWLINQDPARFIPESKYAMVHTAVVKACSTDIGKQHNLVDEPDKCAFDPKALLCKGADRPDCLTAPQVELMQKSYEGPANPATGKTIFPGPARGTELEMSMFAKLEPMSVALDLFRYPGFENPDWDLKTMDWDKTIAQVDEKLGPLLHVDDNLTPFFERGGKLMFYIGWADYHNPEQLVGYYKSLIQNASGKASNAVRLFAIPGMAHCGWGTGCDTFNRLDAIDQWVAQSEAPERIMATKVEDGKIVRSSPLCAYPAAARYKNSGSIDDAANFDCVKQ